MIEPFAPDYIDQKNEKPQNPAIGIPLRRGGRAADCTGLENRSTREGTQGSNPCLSA